MALLSAGLPYEMVEVESAPGSSKMGEDYPKLSPWGPGPAPGLDSGEIVTEGPVIVQKIAVRPRPRRRRRPATVPSVTS
jgi:glutathione S-transferase